MLCVGPSSPAQQIELGKQNFYFYIEYSNAKFVQFCTLDQLVYCYCATVQTIFENFLQSKTQIWAKSTFTHKL